MMSFYIDIAVITGIGVLILLGLVFLKDMRRFPVLSKPAPSGPATHEAGLEQKAESADELLNDGKGTILRFAGWIGVFSAYIVLGLINNIFPLFIRDTLGFGESVAGNILFVRGILSAVGFFLLGKVVFWHFNKRVMLITQTAVASVMVLLIFIKAVPGFYLLFIIFGLLFSMSYSNGIFHGSAGTFDRGRRMALFEAFLTIGVILGSVSGGYLFQYYSIHTAFIFSAAVIAGGLIVQMLIFAVAARKGLR